MKIKYIPFVYTPRPPNIYEVKKIQQKVRESHADFPDPEVFARWDADEYINNALKVCYGIKNVLVNISDLAHKASFRDLGSVHCSWPFLSTQEFKEKTRDIVAKSAIGAYYEASMLFLTDDIMRWIHGEISWTKIKTAATIIQSGHKL
jgi:hypothetical protein